MSCSTRTTARPSAASDVRSRPRVADSRSSRPEHGSSSRSTLGSVERARASSTRRADPVGSDETGAAASSPTPTRSRRSSARAGVARPDASSPTRDVVRRAERREELEALEGPRQAEAGPPVRPLPGDVGPAQRHRSPVGPLQPRDDVEQRGLAGAVRADESGHGPGRRPERDVGERGDPTEVDAHLVDVERGVRRHWPPRVRPAGGRARCPRRRRAGAPGSSATTCRGCRRGCGRAARCRCPRPGR